ncbi:MAG: MtrB/PioB family outer membrane beta-barrel protein [Rhodocyclaceae bacterium]|nr:MtrB/PioB family outer membrane beta-barrel protein [Rhodocyclaceae bacterium]
MYPASSLWTMDTRDTNDTFGLAFQEDLGKNKLSVEYTYSAGRTTNTYNYGSTALAALPAGTAAVETALGNMLPDMKTTQQTLMLNLLVPIDKKLSARFMYRYEDIKITDWHYDSMLYGIVQGTDSGTILLDSGPQNYHNHVIGAYIQYML